jgi:hypothetical protein
LTGSTTTLDQKPGWVRRNLAQLVKWTVYTLLLLNFGYYFLEEIMISSHTLRNGGTLVEWAREFATTIDELAWFGLLFMFELETYVISDQKFNKRVKWSVHGVRVLCYIMLVHTLYARVTTVIETEAVVLAPEISSACQLAGQDISFGANFRYELIESGNCRVVSSDTSFYYLEPTVITDTAGLDLEIKLVWVDLIECIAWFLILFAIELAVWLQEKGITGGALMLTSHAAKLMYALLFAFAAYFWICGFWAIEMNLSEWREEIIEESGVPQTA